MVDATKHSLKIIMQSAVMFETIGCIYPVTRYNVTRYSVTRYTQNQGKIKRLGTGKSA